MLSSFRFVACVMLAIAAVTGSGLELQEGPYRDLAQHVLFLEDVDGALSIDDAIRRYRAGEFAPIPKQNIDFGFSTSTHWLVLPVTNASVAGDNPWILSFNMRFMQRLKVYMVAADGWTLILDNGLESVFSQRAYPYRHIALELPLGAHESREIFIEYWSEGTTAMPLSIETPQTMAELKQFHAIKNSVFYTFVLFMFGYALLFYATVRSNVFRDYAIYVATVIVYIAHMDGYTFQFVWPNLPVWNANAALPLGLGLNIGAAWFSRSFLETATRRPRMHQYLNGVIVVTFIFMLLAFVADVSVLKQYAFPYTFLCAIGFLICGVIAYREDRLGVRFYIIGWLGLTGAALFTTFSHWTSGSLVVGMSFEFVRIGIFIDATMMALAILEQFNEIRKARNREAMDRAALSEETMQLQNRFMDLETSYLEAVNLAEQRGFALATASHDLRQPLMAMRLAMRDLSADTDQRKSMTDTLEYFEALIDRYMHEARAPKEGADGEAGDSNSQPSDRARSEEETFRADIVIDNLKLMFAQDASAAGIDLRVVPSSKPVCVDPLVLIRILSNLLANAIKHSGADRIVLGCRRCSDGISFVVVDNGVGIETQGSSFDALSQPYTRGETPDETGFGLGLSIVRELCDQHGLQLTLRSTGGRGTEIAIRLFD